MENRIAKMATAMNTARMDATPCHATATGTSAPCLDLACVAPVSQIPALSWQIAVSLARLASWPRSRITTSTSGRGLAQNATAHSPFMDALCRTAIEETVAAISRGDLANDAQPGRSARDAWAWTLHVAALISSETHAITAQEPLYPYLVYYERTRLRLLKSSYFLDGLPMHIVVFGHATQVTMPSIGLETHTVRDIVCDRFETLRKLESTKNTAERRAQLSNAYSSSVAQMPEGSPLSLCIFITRIRAINNSLVDVKPRSEFRQCGNHACGRVFMAVPVDYAKTTDPYILALGQTCVFDQLERRFCCRACAHDWRSQRRRAAPIVDIPALSRAVLDDPISERSRPFVELRAASKRNRHFATVFKSLAKRGSKFDAIDRSGRREIRQRCIRTLNLDTAMLYLGTLLAESATTFHRSLPGVASDWRKAETSVRLARFVARLHPAQEEALIVSTLDASRLLDRVKRYALLARAVMLAVE